MIISKDGLTKRSFIELLEFSEKPECQYLCCVSKDKELPTDFQKESVVRLLKVAEALESTVDAEGTRTISYRFSVKVLVEDDYWVPAKGNDDKFCKSGKVPAAIHNEVVRLLSR